MIFFFQTFFTNRAQAYLQLGEASKAVDDCRAAIKLKPESVKSYIHMVFLKQLKFVQTFYPLRAKHFWQEIITMTTPFA